MERLRVKADGPRDAKIAFVGMAPAKEEVAQGRPFVGTAGRVLNEALFGLGIPRESVYVTNVVEFMLPPSGSIFDLTRNEQDVEVRRLGGELEQIQPAVVVPLGDEPLWFTCSLRGIQKWRGSILESTLVPGLKCVPSVHPAWITRGMWKWLPIFKHIDLKRALDESAYSDIRLPQRNAITGPSFNQVLDYIEECSGQDILSFDIETVGMREIACVGIGYRPDEALCIPFVRGSGASYWTEVEECAIWRALGRLLQDPRIRKVAQNASFEWIYFWRYHIYPANLWIDPMHLHHCLYPDFGGTEDIWGRKRAFDEPGHGLAFINSQYTLTPYYKDDGRLWSPTSGDRIFWEYNCKDVMCTLDAALQMHHEALEEGVWDFYQNHYVRAFYHALRMEWSGIQIDIELRDKARVELFKRGRELQGQINDAVGYPLNVNSNKQMKRLLYEDKGYQLKKHRKTGKPTADKEALQYFADKKGDHTLNLIIEKRQIDDLISDIIDQQLGDDNRMRTHYKQGGTDGTRWASTKSILGTGTNLQNVPREGVARGLFLPD